MKSLFRSLKSSPIALFLLLLFTYSSNKFTKQIYKTQSYMTTKNWLIHVNYQHKNKIGAKILVERNMQISNEYID